MTREGLSGKRLRELVRTGRFTEAEHAVIRQNAARAGMSVSCFIRLCALSAILYTPANGGAPPSGGGGDD